MHRGMWIVILSAATIAGLVRLRTLLPRNDTQGHATAGSTCEGGLGSWRCLWLIVCPFLVLALLAASNAPGLIWVEEGFGYDVLEYHLQLPKEYMEAGRIEYVPHNVYANFPANVEMLYLLAMIVTDDARDIGGVANMIHLMFAVLTVFGAWVIGSWWSCRAGVMCAVSIATAGWLAYLSGLAYVENGMLFFGMAATAALLRLMPMPGNAAPQPSSDSRWAAFAGLAAGFACGCKYTALPLIALPLCATVLLTPNQSIGRRIALAAVFATATLATFAPWLIKNTAMTGNPVFPLANTLFDASPPGWGEDQTQRWDEGHSVSQGEGEVGVRLGGLWHHVLWDKYHRFGPMVFLLALVGLCGRRVDRTDMVLLGILVIQLLLWLFATHLLARFAVVLLLPLCLLCGRAIGAGTTNSARHRVIAAALVVGAIWNFAFAARLHARESSPGVPSSFIYEGRIPGYEYFAAVNGDLPPDAKLLLVGEARPFYFQPSVDYCVAFNANPFLEAVLAAKTDSDVLSYLQDRQYTHILVNWSEIRRLARSYGYSPMVEPGSLEALFDRLTASGVRRLLEYRHPTSGAKYVEIYEVQR